MINPVIIKGNKEGIRLIIAPEAKFSEIKKELNKKLQNTRHYYAKQIPIDITFDGKILTEDEKGDILELLRDKGLNIKYKEIKVIETKEKENNFTNLQSDKDGLFYVGNLKNGQSIDAVTSIIIVGNIEQGASVTSESNIIIIGELNGYAKAGSKGKKDAFVYNVY